MAEVDNPVPEGAHIVQAIYAVDFDMTEDDRGGLSKAIADWLSGKFPGAWVAVSVKKWPESEVSDV